MRNYSIRSADGKRVENLVAAARPTVAELEQRGFKGFKVEGPVVPDAAPQQLSADEKEAARLNVMTRSEFMAEVLKRVDERIAKAVPNANVG